MKAKEYIAKHLNGNFKQTLFVEDLQDDLLALLDKSKANDNIKGFDNAVRALKMKFDSMKALSNGEINEGLWKYFYAVVVVKMRERLCPREVKLRKEENHRQFQQRQQRRDMENEMEQMIVRGHRQYVSDAIRTIVCPIRSFTLLGLNPAAKAQHITKRYSDILDVFALADHKELTNDTPNTFIEWLKEHRDKCLRWLETKDFISEW